MFFRKKKQIEHLKNIVRIKEQERRMEYLANCENRKQLAREMRENSRLKRKLATATEKTDEIYGRLGKAEEEIERRRKLYEHGKECTIKVMAELRAQLFEARENNAVYENNIGALAFNIEQRNKNYVAVCRDNALLRGKVAVYEQFIGELKPTAEDNEKEHSGNDNRVSEEKVPGDATERRNDGDALPEAEREISEDLQ